MPTYQELYSRYVNQLKLVASFRNKIATADSKDSKKYYKKVLRCHEYKVISIKRELDRELFP